jgi:hypothetical protein
MIATYGPLVDYGGGARGVPKTRLRFVRSPWGQTVAIHELLAEHYRATAIVAAMVVAEFVPQRIDSFAPRVIRGSTKVSQHAFGLATDTFLTPYPTVPPGGVWDPYELRTPTAKRWLKVWEDFGWRLGAKYTSRPDTPHVEWVEVPPKVDVPPPTPPPAPLPPEQEDDVSRFPIDLEAGPINPSGPFIGTVPTWRLTGPDGGIQALNGAPFHGSVPAIGEARGDCVDLRPYVRPSDGARGYTITTLGVILDPASPQFGLMATYSFP